jgi:flagellar motility protein MotE (MotC chaperone)
MNSKMFGWLFRQHDEIDRLRERVQVLEEDIERRKASYVVREGRLQAMIKENQQQRVLIEALRDVNRSLDERLNEMERGQ